MGIAERREREKEELRQRIVEAARDIVSEAGLDALSMRAIAERIEYSPATIYLYFESKDELVGSVCMEGFRRMGEYMRRELDGLDEDANALERYRAQGRGYVAFALENTAYLTVMFGLPREAHVECPEPGDDEQMLMEEASWGHVVAGLESAVERGEIVLPDVERGAAIGWGMLHGLTSLFLGGHLGECAPTRESFEELVEEAMAVLRAGWNSAAEEPRAVFYGMGAMLEGEDE